MLFFSIFLLRYVCKYLKKTGGVHLAGYDSPVHVSPVLHLVGPRFAVYNIRFVTYIFSAFLIYSKNKLLSALCPSSVVRPDCNIIIIKKIKKLRKPPFLGLGESFLHDKSIFFIIFGFFGLYYIHHKVPSKIGCMTILFI
jgi:hypothetical protein